MSGIAEVSPNYLAEMASNAIPLEYKQTELGMIPEDWEVQDFGSLFQSTVSKKTIKLKTLVSFVGMQDVTERAQLADQHLIPIENVRSGFTYFERGDVLIAKITPCFENGKGCHTELLHSDIGFGSTEFHILRANDLSDSRFIYYWSIREEFRKSLEPEMVGSAGHRRVPLTAISNYQIPVPPKTEQTAIANALSDVDVLISELEKLIAKKQAIKTATMQQLLTGRTRLPQFALREDGTSKDTKPSELGEIPEDWQLGFVGDACDLLTGFPFPSSKYSDSGVRLLRGSNVKRRCTDWSEEITQYWPELTSSIAQYELKIGDIVISMDGSLVGRSFAQLRESDLPALLLQRVARLRSKAVSQNYLKEWVCSKFFTEHCDSVKTVTAIPHISPQDIRSFKLLLPPSKEEQTAIATILSDMDAEIQALEQRLDKTRQIKQGMMQELLTGKTRLIHRSENT